MASESRIYKRELSASPAIVTDDNPLISNNHSVVTKQYNRVLKEHDVTKRPYHLDDSDTSRNIVKKTCAGWFRKSCAFLLSHIGLCGIVVAYSIAGGFIFQALEAPHETDGWMVASRLREKHVEIIWNLTIEANDTNINSNKVDWTREVDLVMRDFQMDMYRVVKERVWGGVEDEQAKWTYANSLLYSITVITTIGYGHIAPKTDYGRLVTIFYALVGIPLTLLCLTKVGALLGNCFRFMYKQTCNCMVCIFLPKRRRRGLKRGGSDLTGSKNYSKVNFRLSDEDRSNGEELIVRVPIIVSISVVAGYVFGGAVLFDLWEPGWDYMISAYFCFITLSTIGFGDFVPGTSLNSWDSQLKSILCALYLVMGLAVIAMCFNLMQEEVKAKFQWLGRKLGLIDEAGIAVVS